MLVAMQSFSGPLAKIAGVLKYRPDKTGARLVER